MKNETHTHTTHLCVIMFSIKLSTFLHFHKLKSGRLQNLILSAQATVLEGDASVYMSCFFAAAPAFSTALLCLVVAPWLSNVDLRL